MRLLLDTHIWLWALLEPRRLASPVAEALVDPSNELWLSPISVWECLLLAERGRLELTTDASRWIEEVTRGWPVRDAPFTREVAVVSRSVDLPHEDPADRFIAASAIVHELMLVTQDGRLRDGRRYETLPI